MPLHEYSSYELIFSLKEANFMIMGIFIKILFFMDIGLWATHYLQSMERIELKTTSWKCNDTTEVCHYKLPQCCHGWKHI